MYAYAQEQEQNENQESGEFKEHVEGACFK